MSLARPSAPITAPPEVSVLMTVYNGLPHVESAVKSIQLQTLTNWEMVIVNDGSTDATSKFLNSLDDRRIQVLHQANGGPPVAANYGLKYCRAEFTARLDADDVALPRRLELQRDFLRAHPDVGLVGSQVAPLGTRLGKSLHLPRDHTSIFNALMHGEHGLCHSSIMCRTFILKDIGGYWESGISDDWDMFLRMGERAELANLDEVLLHYRVLPDSLQSRRMTECRQRVGYACDRAYRRQHGMPSIDYDTFLLERRNVSIWSRVAESCDVYSLSLYRLATADILSGRSLKGYARLAFAAACSPRRTYRRLRRIAG